MTRREQVLYVGDETATMPNDQYNVLTRTRSGPFVETRLFKKILVGVSNRMGNATVTVGDYRLTSNAAMSGLGSQSLGRAAHKLEKLARYKYDS